MKPIRVLHLIDTLGVGGTEHQLALNISALDSERVQSYVCYLSKPNDFEPLFAASNVPVHMLGVNSRRQWAAGVFKLRRLVKELDIGLIHTQLFSADLIGGITGKLAGVPVVGTLANSLYEDEWLIDNPHVNRAKLQFSLSMRKFVARLCDSHLIAVSNSVKSSAVKQLGVPDSKVSVVYRSVSPNWFEPVDEQVVLEKKRELGIEGRYPVIASTGRLIPQKGQRYLVEAMPAIVERFPDAVLLVVGEGFMRASLEPLVDRLGLQNNVRLLGRRRDVRALLHLSDVFAFPSLHEGCPNALLEAMAAGVPVVASNIAPNYEVSSEGELVRLAPPCNPGALADALIETVSQQEHARQVSLKASDMVRRNFTLASASERMTEVFERCLGVNAPRVEMLSNLK